MVVAEKSLSRKYSVFLGQVMLKTLLKSAKCKGSVVILNQVSLSNVNAIADCCENPCLDPIFSRPALFARYCIQRVLDKRCAIIL